VASIFRLKFGNLVLGGSHRQPLVFSLHNTCQLSQSHKRNLKPLSLLFTLSSSSSKMFRLTCLIFSLMLASGDAKLRGSANEQQIRRLEAPTGADQIAFSGDIDDLDADVIAGILATNAYGSFLKFIDGETGAKAILTTKCTQPTGAEGAVICSKSKGEQCVPFFLLKDLSDSERGGYCESFLPLEADLTEQIATADVAFALALWNTCTEKDNNCM
jgi:hypothetical protein